MVVAIQLIIAETGERETIFARSATDQVTLELLHEKAASLLGCSTDEDHYGKPADKTLAEDVVFLSPDAEGFRLSERTDWLAFSSIPSPKVFCFTKPLSNSTAKKKGIGWRTCERLVKEKQEHKEFVEEWVKRCAAEAEYQVMALRVAVSSMQYHAQVALAQKESVEKKVKQVTQWHVQVLRDIDGDLEKLRDIKTPEPIAVAYQDSVHSLRDCVNEDSIKQWSAESFRLDDALATALQQLEADCTKVSQKADLLLKTTTERADALIGQVSTVANESGRVELMLEIREKVQQEFDVAFRSVARVEAHVFQVMKQTSRLAQGIDGQRCILSKLESVRKLPEVFAKSLEEVKRRNRFKALYKERIAQLAEEVAAMCDEENEKREDFTKAFGKHLPVGLIPGLSKHVERVPKCELVQRPFDEDLPVLLHGDESQNIE